MSQRPGKQRDRSVESPAEPEHDASELPEGWANAVRRSIRWHEARRCETITMSETIHDEW